jgi:hypothetical protein
LATSEIIAPDLQIKNSRKKERKDEHIKPDQFLVGIRCGNEQNVLIECIYQSEFGASGIMQSSKRR